MATARKSESEPNYLVVAAVVAGIAGVGLAVANAHKRKLARGQIKARPKPPPVAYDKTTEALKTTDTVLLYRVGQVARVRATANPSAGIFWQAAVDQPGPEGSPVAVRKITDGAAETFTFTGVRPGSIRAVVTALDPDNRVVDSVVFHIEITE